MRKQKPAECCWHEFEVPEELRKVTVGRAPTERQRREHEGENHSMNREWCEVCVAARGTGAQHQNRRRKRQVDQEPRGPIIFSDSTFHEHKSGVHPHACSEILKIWKNYSDSTFEQRSDRILSEILWEVHRENRHQETRQLQRQRAVDIGTQRCSSTKATICGTNS